MVHPNTGHTQYHNPLERKREREREREREIICVFDVD
jgi:hypothetical protein